MPKVKKAQPSASSYQTRDDLLQQIVKLSRMVERQRKALIAKPANLSINEPDDEDPIDADSLPEVQLEGVPFRPQVQSRQQGSTRAFRQSNVSQSNGQIVIHPTPYVRSLFSKPRRGLGGFQSLHAALQSRMGGSKELVLNPADFARVINYAVNYGEGGFQQSLRWLVALYAAEHLAPEMLHK